MRLHPNQLAPHLKKGLTPLYLLFGDEPLQLAEATDAVRQAAKSAGYDYRSQHDIDADFNWNRLLEEINTPPLFAERRLLELRLPSGKLGNPGVNTVQRFLQQKSEDMIMLIIAGKITAAAQKSKWFNTLDRAGVVVAVRPVKSSELIPWLSSRMERRGINCDDEGLRALAQRVEGNLLAADQEIEKLYVLYGAARINAKTIIDVVSDSARYDVYRLVDSALLGSVAAADRMFAGVRAEGLSEVIVSWALAREIRVLEQMAFAIAHGASLHSVMQRHRVWGVRKPMVERALKRFNWRQLQQLLRRCGVADREIKGAEEGDCWATLHSITMQLAGVRVLLQPELH